MVQLWIPDRFMVRSVEEFSEQLDNLGSHYWYHAYKGELTNETALGLTVKGAFEAAQWLAGAREIPPGSAVARVRTRFDLLDLLSIAELACFDDIGRWESVVRERTGALEYFERHEASGARVVWEWALGLRAEPPLRPLLPEHVRQAEIFFQRMAMRARREAA